MMGAFSLMILFSGFVLAGAFEAPQRGGHLAVRQAGEVRGKLGRSGKE